MWRETHPESPKRTFPGKLLAYPGSTDMPDAGSACFLLFKYRCKCH